MADADRKYNDEEFALILRKASQIQDGSGGADTDAGLSLDEIRAIAREVGIDPTAVDRAAALVPRTASRRDAFSRVMGGPTLYRLESTVQGTMSETDMARMLDSVRRAAEHHGKVEYGPRGFEWSTQGDVNQINVTALPLEDGLHIRVTADRGGAALLTVFFSFLAWLVAAGITGATVDPGSATVGASIVAGGLLGGFAQSRILWTRSTRAIRDKLQRIMSSLTGAAESVETSPEDAD